jgi:hypothetical protein
LSAATITSASAPRSTASVRARTGSRSCTEREEAPEERSVKFAVQASSGSIA